MKLGRFAEPGLLVSVRNSDEARAAIAGGADWIDLKEPAAGALGSVHIPKAREVAEFIGDQIPLSAALGELRGWPNQDSQSLLDVPQISYVKLGLAGMKQRKDWAETWCRADRQAAAADKRLVAVAYADWQQVNAPPPEDVMEIAEQSSARCLLIDTYDKQLSGTLQQWGTEMLLQIVSDAKQRGLSVVLAGKLRLSHITALPLQWIDLLAVRSAACRANRIGIVDESLVLQFKQQMLQCHHVANC